MIKLGNVSFLQGNSLLVVGGPYIKLPLQGCHKLGFYPHIRISEYFREQSGEFAPSRIFGATTARDARSREGEKLEVLPQEHARYYSWSRGSNLLDPIHTENHTCAEF